VIELHGVIKHDTHGWQRHSVTVAGSRPAVPPQNGHVMINDLALTIVGNLTVDRN
jgi:hypothetical protein